MITPDNLRAWHAYETEKQLASDLSVDARQEHIRGLSDEVIAYLSPMHCMSEYREEHARRASLDTGPGTS